LCCTRFRLFISCYLYRLRFSRFRNIVLRCATRGIIRFFRTVSVPRIRCSKCRYRKSCSRVRVTGKSRMGAFLSRLFQRKRVLKGIVFDVKHAHFDGSTYLSRARLCHTSLLCPMHYYSPILFIETFQKKSNAESR